MEYQQLAAQGITMLKYSFESNLARITRYVEATLESGAVHILPLCGGKPITVHPDHTSAAVP